MDKKQLEHFYKREEALLSLVVVLSLISIVVVICLLVGVANESQRTVYSLLGLFFSILFISARIKSIRLEKEQEKSNKE